MALGRVFVVALLGSTVAAVEQDCSADGCDGEEASLLALRGVASATQCKNRHGDPFECASADRCCGDVCVAQGDECCVNVEGDFFPCQGKGGQCCGNACAAPGSKCCRSPYVERSRWYAVSMDTQCSFSLLEEEENTPEQLEEEGDAFPEEEGEASAELLESGDASPTQCYNRHGTPFQCASADRCCGDVCVAQGDVCCVNVEGNFFPCQGKGGQCCGNACAAPGSKCCRSPHVERSRWYPVSKETQCSFSLLEEEDASPELLEEEEEELEDASREMEEEEEELEDASPVEEEQLEEDVASATLLESGEASPTQCYNRHGTPFQCASADRCCGDVCVAQGDVCCVNVEGNFFPCQGKGGQCCGNACAAPGSKCCRSPSVERSRWYPVSIETQCHF